MNEEYAHKLKHKNHIKKFSGNHSETKYLFELKNQPQHHCYKPTENYLNTYGSLYIEINYIRFDTKTGLKIQAIGPHHLNYQSIAFCSKPGKFLHLRPWPENRRRLYHTLINLDYELQQGTKLD